MRACKCHHHDRQTLYTSLFEIESKHHKMGEKLLQEEVWSQWFGFNTGRAFHSLLHRLELVLGICVTEEDREAEWLHAVAQTLVTALDVDRITIKGHQGTELAGPRVVLDDDKLIEADPRYGLVFEGKRSSLYSELQLFGRHKLCDVCLSEINRFLAYAQKLWGEGQVSLGEVYRGEVFAMPTSSERSHHENDIPSTGQTNGNYALRQLGMSETLEAHFTSILYRIWQTLATIGRDLGSELFQTFFKHKKEKGTLDPWAFNLIFQKTAPHEGEGPGFGYILTDRQIKSIRQLAERYSSSSGEIAFWNVYEAVRNAGERADGRVIEAIWQLHHYDGFVREETGLIRIPYHTSLPTVISVDEYAGIVKESPIRDLEDELIHSPWIMEVPIYEKRIGAAFPPQASFRAIAWLMSTHRLPPIVRLAFLDVVREKESLLVSWINLFSTQAEQIRQSIAKGEKIRWLYRKSHNLRDAKETMNELLEEIRRTNLSEDEKQKLEEKVRWSILNIDSKGVSRYLKNNLETPSQPITRDTLKQQLREIIKTAAEQKRMILEEPTVLMEDEQEGWSLSEPILDYIRDATLTLSKNSIHAAQRFVGAPDAIRPPFIFRLTVSNEIDKGNKFIILEARDSAGGLTEQATATINELFNEYRSGWGRKLYLNIDLPRWSSRLQATLGQSITLDAHDRIKHQGWYSLIADFPGDIKPEVKVSTDSVEQYRGLLVRIKIPVLD